MPSDLDRAYVINGADLRYALAGRDGRPPLVPNPGDVAAWLLEYAGKPLDAPVPGVTDLGQALAELAVDIEQSGLVYIGRLRNPEKVADAALSILHNRRFADMPRKEPGRWPMTRGELETRLSKALADTGDYLDPGALAAKLAGAIDAQGEEDAAPEPCPFPHGNGGLGECNCELKKYAMRSPGSPGYYDGKTGMQPFDVIDEFGLDFYEGNVVKYLVRWRKKNGLEDLRKARTYLNRIIARAEAESAT